MSPSTEQRIVAALERAERSVDRTQEVLDELADVKGAIIRVEGKVDANERSCEARHNEVLGKTLAHHERLGKIETRQEAERDSKIVDLKEAVKTREESQRHWLRYVVSALVAFVCGGGIALLSKFTK